MTVGQDPNTEHQNLSCCCSCCCFCFCCCCCCCYCCCYYCSCYCCCFCFCCCYCCCCCFCFCYIFQACLVYPSSVSNISTQLCSNSIIQMMDWQIVGTPQKQDSKKPFVFQTNAVSLLQYTLVSPYRRPNPWLKQRQQAANKQIVQKLETKSTGVI